MIPCETLELNDSTIQVLDALLDGLTIYDRNATLIWANTRACEILGVSRADIIGLNVSEIATLPTVKAIQTDDFGSGSSMVDDIRCQRRDLSAYTSPGFMEFENGTRMLYVGNLVKDVEGHPRYAVYTQHDTTALDDAQRRIQELEKLANLYREQLAVLHPARRKHDIICSSLAMQRVLDRASKIAKIESTVLITGETGVGKNLLANYMHRESARASGPFIHVNCACLPESLIEAELFGYAEGSFTGANRKGRRGLIQIADGGTLFLDEISEMPMAMQAKLLSVIEERTVRRIGSDRWNKVDVRIIAASNKSLDQLRAGEVLRQDLYYRLTMNTVHVPPLRERKADIPALVEHIMADFNETNGVNLSLDPRLVASIGNLPLRGNVREIRNLIWQIAVEFTPDSDPLMHVVIPADAARMLNMHTLDVISPSVADTSTAATTQATTAARNPEEASRLSKLAHRHDGDVYKIAEELDIHRTTVIRKLKRYGIPYARRQSPVHA